MRGCAGAGSIQARTPIRTRALSLALHPRLDLYGFGVLSNSDRSCLLICPAHLARAGGCKVWAGSGSRLLVFIEMKPCLRPCNLEPGGHV